MGEAMNLDEKFALARQIGQEACKHFEARHLESYVLNGEKWATIGWGEAIPLIQHPKKITQKQADARFQAVWMRKEAALRAEIPAAVLEKLTIGQLAGIMCFRYNMKDSAWLNKTCNTRKFLVMGDIPKFIAMHSRWINGEAGPLQGLKRRRHVERDLMQGKPLTQIVAAGWYESLYNRKV
jgi:GH24 family phage-related lysozyme (muramidase)